MMDPLHYFDGRPTDQAVNAIADERGIRLDPSLVRKLLDFELLILHVLL
ncbi:MAG: hypothetical protein ABR555_02905 [Pyrinomonadaceae bacterium]